MTMFDPPHPGEIIREECLAPLGLSVAKAAEMLDVSRQAVHNIISEKSGVSREMALRLEKAFGPEAGFWLRLHDAYRLAKGRKKKLPDGREKDAPAAEP